MDPAFSPSNALDFGCGVGRCSIPLAKICDRIIGLDISEPMLVEARKNCLEQSISNIAFIKSDDVLHRILPHGEHFDFIHSFSTFYNFSPKRGYKILEELTDVLSENGNAAIELIYNATVSPIVKIGGKMRKVVPLVNNFINLIYKRPFSEPLMEKNEYDLNKILIILNAHNCGNVHIGLLNHNKLQNIILFFQKKKDDTPLYSY